MKTIFLHVLLPRSGYLEHVPGKRLPAAIFSSGERNSGENSGKAQDKSSALGHQLYNMADLY